MDKLYTAGELAKLAGISSRSIRYYDEKGILKPECYSEGHYRMYGKQSLITLQEILMLKYVGLSLQQICEVLEQNNNCSVEEILQEQRILLLEKRQQMDDILGSLEELKDYCSDFSIDVEQFSDAMQLITSNKKHNQRWNIYDKYAIRQNEWRQWRYKQLALAQEMEILDVGFGHGMIWLENWAELPINCKVTAVDKTAKGIAFFQYHMEKKTPVEGVSFSFHIADAEQISLENNRYHRILANSFWSYIDDRKSFTEKLKNGLRQDGMLISAFSSQIDEKRVNELLFPFIGTKVHLNREDEKVQLLEQMIGYFKGYFAKVESVSFQNILCFPNEEEFYLYLKTLDYEIGHHLEKRRWEFLRYLSEWKKKGEEFTMQLENTMVLCQ